MRKPREGDLVEVPPKYAYPNLGLLLEIFPTVRYSHPYRVRVLRNGNNLILDVEKVQVCIVNFAGVVRL
jgi:hypothetical protein